MSALNFTRQSLYSPLSVTTSPQKIAIGAMELSLRLNYKKYQLQQEKINQNENYLNELTNDDYKYINPPTHWFQIFDVNMNEQDLKDEVNLIANEILNALQDLGEFGDDFDIEKLKKFRKNTLKMDKIHKQIIEKQKQQQSQRKITKFRSRVATMVSGRDSRLVWKIQDKNEVNSKEYNIL